MESVASLAPTVARAALNGSSEGREIFEKDSSHLLGLVNAISVRYSIDDFVAVGGVFSLDKVILEQMRNNFNGRIEHFEGDIPSKWLAVNG